MRLAAALLLLPATAFAEPAGDNEVSLPLVLGFGNGFVVGARPELLRATDAEGGSGFELGGYGLIASDNGELLAGAGLTALHYHGNGFAYGPSVGYTTHGLEVGMFIGLRWPEHMLIDIPAGLRVDGHFDPDGTKELVVSMQVDVVAWLLLQGIHAIGFQRD